MKKLTLTFTERFYLTQLMPSEDSFTNIISKKSLSEKIGISNEEEKKHNFKIETNKCTWKKTGETIEVELNPNEVIYLKEKLKAADAKKVLSEELVDVYTAIV